MSLDDPDSWSDLSETERSLLTQVDGDRLMADTDAIARWVRLSGEPGETEAVRYVVSRLTDAGLEPQVVWHDALISLPRGATLRVEAPVEDNAEFVCITHSFGVRTQPGGLTGELVWVGSGRMEDYVDVDVRGKIVLVQGLASPEATRLAGLHGAAAQVHINDAQLHEMIVSPIWGSPGLDEYSELPRTAVVSIRADDGARLRSLLARGPVTLHLTAQVETGWRQIPLVTADLVAAGSPRYVLFSGHLDSWHHGAMDNGSANATMLEVMRILSANRDSLRRGVRVAFWSGHSHGRYAGSAWYADEHWLDIERNCVAHVNVDSTGAVGATVLGEANVMAEARALAASCVQSLVPSEKFTGTRFGRAGDQSFWGHGVPSLFMSLSQQPADDSGAAASFHAIIGPGGGRSGGLGWWWHTTHDTMDKIDRANLVRDTRIYLLTLLRLGTSLVLPFDYRAVAEELRDALRRLMRRSTSHDLGLASLWDELDALQAVLEEAALNLARLAWQTEYGRRKAATGAMALERAEQLLIRLGRLLIPVGYVAGCRYGHDPALPTSALPALARRIQDLTRQEPGSDLYRAAAISLARERNRVTHALSQARLAAEGWLAGGK